MSSATVELSEYITSKYQSSDAFLSSSEEDWDDPRFMNEWISGFGEDYSEYKWEILPT